MQIWFGGYTKTSSKGIYTSELVNGALTTPELKVPIQNATYFQIDSNNNLFSILKDGDKGGLAYYHFENGQAQLVDTFLAAGSPPAYVGLNEPEKLVYAANYHGELLQVFSYATKQLELVASVKHAGRGPKPEQTTAHPHYFDQTPAGNLVSADLGTDTVDFYHLDGHELKHLASYQNEKGFGTRHIVFHPTAPVMFVVGELSSEVNVVRFDERSWQLTNLGYYKTIPADFTAQNGAAAVKLSRDGQFLYVSNRGHNSIAVFKVDQETFKLQLIQQVSVYGDFPRDFNWDSGETNVVVANQNSDNATLYKRNTATGFLTMVQENIVVPEATRVLFREDSI